MRLWFLLPLLLLPLLGGEALADQTDPALEGLFADLAEGAEPDATRREIERRWLTPQEPGIAILMERAVSAAQAGEVSVAANLTDDITAIAPHYAEGWLLKGRLALARDDADSAGRAFRRVVHLEPRHYQAYRLMGEVAEREGRGRAALLHYLRVREIDPEAPDIDRAIDDVKMSAAGQEI